MKLTLAALALTFLPTFAFAVCSGDEVDQTAASCMPGTVWDAETSTCVEAPSS